MKESTAFVIAILIVAMTIIAVVDRINVAPLRLGYCWTPAQRGVNGVSYVDGFWSKCQ